MVFVPQIATPNGERRGVVLLIVIALLSLFASVGISFVFYAEAESTAMQYFRESTTNLQADIDPELLLSYYLSQLIYDVDDTNGAYSAMRGHSLARTMYGYNYPAPGAINNVPYNGIGRHFTDPQFSADSYNFPNYTYYPSDGYIRDPERIGTRTSNTAAQTNPYFPCNASYTYPDANNMFLAAMNANGAILAPSFYRPWMVVAGNKYTNLRPDKTYNQVTVNGATVQFPDPEDGFADVKNLDNSLGVLQSNGTYSNYDSIWMDLGFPVMIAPNGQKFKPLFAALILDLDGKVNLNAHGNIRGLLNGTTVTHAANQGWGPWEINIANVLTANTTEWTNLFNGSGTVAGRYGLQPANTQPTMTNSPGVTFLGINPGTQGGVDYRVYAQADLDGVQNTTGTQFALSNKYYLPGETGNPNNVTYFPFPFFDSASYGNGTDGFELVNHPSLFNVFNPTLSGANYRVFDWSHMEALLRLGSTGSPALTSDLFRLCPTNFGTNGRARWQVTTHSFDSGRPGLTPWLYSAGATANPYQIAGALPYPTGAYVPSPAATSPSTVTPSTPNPTEFSPLGDWRGMASWQDFSATVGRLNLNRNLASYPAADGTGTLVNSLAQFQTAQTARQQFAMDIFKRLRYATTGAQPTDAVPAIGSSQYLALQWLAQLAVNIVDFIDNDDYITPFNWVPTTDPSYSVADPTQWVYGTELPKVVINEAYAQVSNDPTDPLSGVKATLAYKLNFWVELLNPIGKTDPNSTVQMWMPAGGLDGTGTNAQYPIYKLAVAGPPVIITLTGATGGTFTLTYGNPTNMTAPIAFNAAATDVQTALAAILPANASISVTGANGGPWTITYQNVPLASLTYTSSLTPATATIAITFGAPLFTDTNLGTPGDVILELSDYTPAPAAAAPVSLQGYAPPNPPMFTLTPADVNYSGPSGQNQGFYVVGPIYDVPNSYVPNPPPANLPQATLRVKDYVNANNNSIRNSMTYEIAYQTSSVSYTALKHNLSLRRLACPLLPPQTNPANANYNPYVTVDYVQNLPTYDGVNNDAAGMHVPATFQNRFAWGRNQPYAGSQQVQQMPDTGGAAPAIAPYTDRPQQTLFRHNAVDSASPPQNVWTVNGVNNTNTLQLPFDWLVHLDRSLISPMELLNASAFPPYQLTQQFMAGATRFNHRLAPVVLDTNSPVGSSSRLYRAFELLEVPWRATGVSTGGRIPGKININSIWDVETMLALCSPSSTNYTAASVNALLTTMLNSRTPNVVSGVNVPSAADRPFKSLAAPYIGVGDTLYPNGSSIDDTFLRRPSGSTTNFLFEVTPGVTNSVTNANMDNPYLRYELMNRIFNNVTTRSHVFGVWLTVGFFQVFDFDPTSGAALTPPKLGPEIGKLEGRNIRHRMFALIDRSQLQIFSTSGTAPAAITPSTTPVTITAATSGTSANGASWTLTPGMLLEVDVGSNTETVVVQTVPAAGSFTAVFHKAHAASFSIVCRGNPGPWLPFNASLGATAPVYNQRLDTQVVPYFSIIQ